MKTHDHVGGDSRITIRNRLKPGDIGSIIYLHGVLYDREYGFDHTFEAYVAGPLADFVRSQTDREKIWIVERNDRIKGSIAIVRFSEETAQLRWLLLHPDVRGLGIGKKLLEEALNFCREAEYTSVFLWTVGFLHTATRLYKSFGFQLTEQKTHEIWGHQLTEERYDLRF